MSSCKWQKEEHKSLMSKRIYFYWYRRILIGCYVIFLAVLLSARPERICSFDIGDDVFFLRGQSPAHCYKDSDKSKYAIKPRPIVISGPSGVGKGTLISQLLLRFPKYTFGFSTSHTTRSARPGEIDGEHYHFVSMADMTKSLEEGEFIEHSHVHGNVYGTSYSSVSSVQESGKICILDIDVNGAENVKVSGMDPLLIFIAPPSMDDLEERLRGRNTETEDAIQKRLTNARAELDRGLSDKYFDTIIVNDNMEAAVDELVSIVLEHYREMNLVPNNVTM